jgi:hypothetical protein
LYYLFGLVYFTGVYRSGTIRVVQRYRDFCLDLII